MTDREIICTFLGIVAGVLLMGLSMLLDPPEIRVGGGLTVRVDRGAAVRVASEAQRIEKGEK